jgi:branched-chain amino acid transport system permease protein
MGGYIAYGVFFLTVASIYALICLGLNLQWGATGLFNVGVAGFFAVGAYATAILTCPDFPGQVGGFSLPVPVGWLGALLAGGLAALLVGIPTLRLRDDYLAISTFGIAIVIQLVALNFQPLTGGALGINFIPRPLAAWFSDPSRYGIFFLAVVAAIVGAAYWALERLVRSPWGRVLRAIREDEAAAAALGKSPTVFRLQAFVLGSMLMGLAGGLHASFYGFISPADFQPILTFQAWTMLVLGGSGNNRGALVGAVAVWALWSASGALLHAVLPADLQVRGAALQIVLIGVVLAAALLFRPRGLIGEEPIVSRHARL